MRYQFAKYTQPRPILVHAQLLPGVPLPRFSFDRGRSNFNLSGGRMWIALTARMSGKVVRLQRLGLLVYPDNRVWMDHAGYEALEVMLRRHGERLAGYERGVERYDELWLLEAMKEARVGVQRWAPAKLGMVVVKADDDLDGEVLESEAAQ